MVVKAGDTTGTTNPTEAPDPTEATRLSTAPRSSGVLGSGPVALVRRWWRQLTSMRTALLLLFLLAIAAVPGSVLPQRDLDLTGVGQFYADHPRLAPFLDRLGMFEVYASPWFGAIYLLLFISLVGCLVPRMRLHLRAMWRKPPDAPQRLDRLPQYARVDGVAASPAEHVTVVRHALRRRWWRVAVREHPDGTVTVSAEKGYLRETGNLLFHFSFLAVLVGVALGSMYGWYGNRLLVAGPEHAFCNTLQQYDDHGLGSRIDASDLEPFCVELVDFYAEYLDNGQPVQYSADVLYTTGETLQEQREYRLEVNSPLRLDAANIYLVGHGYAPVLRYTDRYGVSQTVVAPFLPNDNALTSEGVAAFPDANINPETGQRDPDQQVAFQGVYMPTMPEDPQQGISVFPAENDPGLVLFAYRGDLGLDAGIPQSVYQLNQDQIDAGRLVQIEDAPRLMRPGDEWVLDDGTTLEFLGTRQWVTVQVRHDPGESIVLVAAVLLFAGLIGSLTVRRRRVWFRLTPHGDGTAFTAGGLSRTRYAGFEEEFTRLVDAVTPASTRRDAVPPESSPTESAAEEAAAEETPAGAASSDASHPESDAPEETGPSTSETRPSTPRRRDD